MKLSAEQEKIIEDFVDTQGIKIRTLRDDVVDHLCCKVESELEKGKSFEQLLAQASADLAPKGLQDLQHTTVFLLNAKRIILMKRLMYLIGFLSSLTLTAGLTLKLLQLPYAGGLFIAGFLALFLIFIPLLAIDRFKASRSKALPQKLKLIFGTVAALAIGFSGLFKLIHVQGADLLLLLGALVFAFGFLPFYYLSMYRKSLA